MREKSRHIDRSLFSPFLGSPYRPTASINLPNGTKLSTRFRS